MARKHNLLCFCKTRCEPSGSLWSSGSRLFVVVQSGSKAGEAAFSFYSPGWCKMWSKCNLCNSEIPWQSLCVSIYGLNAFIHVLRQISVCMLLHWHIRRVFDLNEDTRLIYTFSQFTSMFTCSVVVVFFIWWVIMPTVVEAKAENMSVELVVLNIRWWWWLNNSILCVPTTRTLMTTTMDQRLMKGNLL